MTPLFGVGIMAGFGVAFFSYVRISVFANDHTRLRIAVLVTCGLSLAACVGEVMWQLMIQKRYNIHVPLWLLIVTGASFLLTLGVGVESYK